MTTRANASTTPNGFPTKRPPKLGSEGRKMWDLCVDLAANDELQPYAVPTVTMLCKKVDLLKKVSDYCDEIPVSAWEVTQSNGSPMLRPIFKHWGEVEKEALALLRELGLTPASAAKLRAEVADTHAITEAFGALSKTLRGQGR